MLGIQTFFFSHICNTKVKIYLKYIALADSEMVFEVLNYLRPGETG